MSAEDRQLDRDDGVSIRDGDLVINVSEAGVIRYRRGAAFRSNGSVISLGQVRIRLTPELIDELVATLTLGLRGEIAQRARKEQHP